MVVAISVQSSRPFVGLVHFKTRFVDKDMEMPPKSAEVRDFMGLSFGGNSSTRPKKAKQGLNP